MKLKNSARINSLPVYKPGKPIAELERELGFKDPVKLASNENPLGPAPSVVEKIKEAKMDDFSQMVTAMNLKKGFH